MSEFNLEKTVESWDQKELVKFNLFCCYKVKHLMNKESLKAVELVKKWLKDEKSVSDEELMKAAHAAYNTDAAYAAAYAAYNAAYYTAYVAYNVDAANTANNAAHYAANNATYNAARALNTSSESLYLEYMREKLSNIMES